MKVRLRDFVVLAFLSSVYVSGQVCSPPGQLCTKTTDCCKGCCEAHTCMDRSFPCSTDLIAQPGYNSCVGYFCAVGHICYLREVCPPENPCPPQPSCRKVDTTSNYSYSLQSTRNFYPRTSASPLYTYVSVAIFFMALISNVFL